jgi:hypothetical protein
VLATRWIKERVAARERLGERLTRRQVDVQLVTEVDDPLSRSTVVESLEVLRDGRPRTALLGRSSHRCRESPDSTTVFGMIRTVNQYLLEIRNVHRRSLDGG